MDYSQTTFQRPSKRLSDADRLSDKLYNLDDTEELEFLYWLYDHYTPATIAIDRDAFVKICMDSKLSDRPMITKVEFEGGVCIVDLDLTFYFKKAFDKSLRFDSSLTYENCVTLVVQNFFDNEPFYIRTIVNGDDDDKSTLYTDGLLLSFNGIDSMDSIKRKMPLYLHNRCIIKLDFDKSITIPDFKGLPSGKYSLVINQNGLYNIRVLCFDGVPHHLKDFILSKATIDSFRGYPVVIDRLCALFKTKCTKNTSIQEFPFVDKIDNKRSSRWMVNDTVEKIMANPQKAFKVMINDKLFD